MSLLRLLRDNDFGLSKTELSESQKKETEKNTGEKSKDIWYYNPREVKESLICLAKQLDLDLIKYAQSSDGVALVADETTNDANFKRYNINVCCLKKWFFGKMTEVENAFC